MIDKLTMFHVSSHVEQLYPDNPPARAGYSRAAKLVLDISDRCNDPAEAYSLLQEIRRALCTR